MSSYYLKSQKKTTSTFSGTASAYQPGYSAFSPLYGQHPLVDSSAYAHNQASLFGVSATKKVSKTATAPASKSLKQQTPGHFEKKRQDRAKKELSKPRKLSRSDEKTVAAIDAQLAAVSSWDDYTTYREGFNTWATGIFSDPNNLQSATAVSAYSGGGMYATVNGVLRDHEVVTYGSREQYLEQGRTLMDFLNTDQCTMQQDTVVVRHMDLEGLRAAIGVPADTEVRGVAETLKHFGKSKTFMDKGFLSTTLLPKGVEQFASTSNVECRILLPKGTHAMYLDPVSHFSDADYDGHGENEVLVQAGTKFTIVDMKEDKRTHKLVVYMTANKRNKATLSKTGLARKD